MPLLEGYLCNAKIMDMNIYFDTNLSKTCSIIDLYIHIIDRNYSHGGGGITIYI